MAVIDTFLKLLVSQRAERLVLAPNNVPTVFKADKEIQLPMPAVPADLAHRLAVEIVGKSQAESLGADPLQGSYRSDDGDEFTYEVSAQGGSSRIEMHWLGLQEEIVESAAKEGRAPVARSSEVAFSIKESAGPPATPKLDRVCANPFPDPEILFALERALQADASDVFLSGGKAVRARINGVIKPLDSPPLVDEQILNLIPLAAQRRELEESGSVDFGVRWEISGTSRRFRINVFRHVHGLAAALRPIRARIPSAEELNLPGNLLDLCSYPSGLVLVTGASGSGKSTTLAAMVEHINQTRARHIITIEDPIEFEHREARSLIHQREVGTNVESFSTGLRAALRENPDVILLGEMRDLATISAALTAAETGHLVLSTLHTGNATAAINRIVDAFPGHQQAHVRTQLSASLRAVVSQRLVPTADGSGRVPALEKLIVNPAVANGIREGHEHHMKSAIQTGVEEGMITLERSLAALECRGVITRDTAFRYAHDQQALRKLIE